MTDSRRSSPAAAREGVAFGTPPAPPHNSSTEIDVPGYFVWSGTEAKDDAIAESLWGIRRYREWKARARANPCRIVREHMPFKGHRTCAEWVR